VTGEYQLTSAVIGGENYIFVDTPGFADPESGRSAEAVYRNIMEFVQLVQGAVTFVGILFVHRVSNPHTIATANTLKIMEAFAGVDYFPFMTFVTTYWDGIHERELRTTEENVDELIKHQWGEFFQKGSMLYHHGKRYNDAEPTDEILPKTTHGDLRQEEARNMIVRHYKGRDPSTPLVVQELNETGSVDETSAARLIGIVSQARQSQGAVPPQGQGQQSSERNEPPGPNWIEALKSILFDTGRSFFDYVMGLLQRLPRGTSWRTRHSQRRGIEVVLTLPYGPRLVVGVADSGRPTMYMEGGPGDASGVGGIPDESDLEFEYEQPMEFGISGQEEDLNDDQLGAEEFIHEFEEAKARHRQSQSSWGFCIIL